MERPHARRDAGSHGDQRAALGSGGRPLWQQGAGHSIAGCVRAHERGDGLRDRTVATGGAARAPRRLRRLRRLDDGDGGGVGPPRRDAAGHRFRADGPAPRSGARPDRRRSARAHCRTASRLSGDGLFLSGRAGNGGRVLSRAAHTPGAGGGPQLAVGGARAGGDAWIPARSRRDLHPPDGRPQLQPDSATLRRTTRHGR